MNGPPNNITTNVEINSTFTSPATADAIGIVYITIGN
jgi:hypothetical protein